MRCAFDIITRHFTDPIGDSGYVWAAQHLRKLSPQLSFRDLTLLESPHTIALGGSGLFASFHGVTLLNPTVWPYKGDMSAVVHVWTFLATLSTVYHS